MVGTDAQTHTHARTHTHNSQGIDKKALYLDVPTASQIALSQLVVHNPARAPPRHMHAYSNTCTHVRSRANVTSPQASM